jgi:hypothetical protein
MLAGIGNSLRNQGSRALFDVVLEELAPSICAVDKSNIKTIPSPHDTVRNAMGKFRNTC